MKKKLGLYLILLLELALIVIYSIYHLVGTPAYLEFIHKAGQFYRFEIIGFVNKLIHLDGKFYGELVSFILINLCFIIIYYCIFCTISLIIKASKKRRIARVVKVHYELNETEEDRFDYKNFMKRFPKRRVISLIIPLLFIALFVLARLDKVVCEKTLSEAKGVLNVYSSNIEPFINRVFNGDTTVTDFILKLFHNSSNIGYVDLVNKFSDNISWIEYVITTVASILLLVIWYFFFTLLYLPFRKLIAKRKAKIARENYILKKEYKEYKLRLKHRNEYSSKSEAFMNMVEEDNQEQQEIAKTKNTPKLSKGGVKPSDYYDDLGHGVRDLGVGVLEEAPVDKAIIEREVRYISDKDYDIVLESEPVIEIVEEDGIDQLLQQYKEDELFYEKYQPNDIDLKTYEEHSKNKQIINDYVSEINKDGKEVENTDLVEENKVEEVKVEEKPEEKVEEKVEEIIPEEEPVVEEKAPEVVEDTKANKEENPDDGLTPLQRYQLERKRLLAERQALIDANALTEENDPLKKYRKPGARTGKIEARVPTVKEQEAEKQRKREERAAKRRATMEAKARAQGKPLPKTGKKK